MYRLEHEARWNLIPTNSVVIPQYCTEVYCFSLDFNISKLFYFFFIFVTFHFLCPLALTTLDNEGKVLVRANWPIQWTFIPDFCRMI